MRAADELEAIGRSRPRRSPSLTQLLTPHEQEVVEPAITGATTREMATDLFVSPKTVESHLTSSTGSSAFDPRPNWLTSSTARRLGVGEWTVFGSVEFSRRGTIHQ